MPASRITFQEAGASVARSREPSTATPLSGRGLSRSGFDPGVARLEVVVAQLVRLLQRQAVRSLWRVTSSGSS